MPDLPKPELESKVAADLVNRIGQGDRDAEHALHQRYERGLHYLIRRRTGDEQLAEDICQRTFIIALEKLRASAVKKPESLASFLRSTALNLLVADQRKAIRQGTTPDSETVELTKDHGPGPFDEVSREQVQEAVRELLKNHVNPRYREILMLFYIEEQDKESICRLMELSSKDFNQVLSRAKKSFRTILEDAKRKGRLRLVG